MKGIVSTSVCKSTLDEAPQAYKNPKVIENAIQPTAKILDLKSFISMFREALPLDIKRPAP